MHPSTEHTHQILVNFSKFERMSFLERKTVQEPLLAQVDLNQGIKEGVDFKILFAEINNKQQKGSNPQVF